MNESFVDTNVALYLTSPDQRKAEVAERLVRRGGTISVQVLTEVADVMRRKFRAPWAAVDDTLSALKETLAVVPVGVETHELGVAIAERYQFRVYDAQLVAAALLAGCSTFWSEDLHNGQVIDGQLTIRNPFV